MKVFNGDTLICIEVFNRSEARYLTYFPAKEGGRFKSSKPEGISHHYIDTTFYTLEEFKNSNDFRQSYLEDGIVYEKSYVLMTFIGDVIYREYFKYKEESENYAEKVRAKFMNNSFTSDEINMKEGSYKKFKNEYIKEIKKEASSLSV